MLSDADRAAIEQSRGTVELSTKDVNEARKGNFVPWNCPFVECGTPVPKKG
jgi:hypothetical protein